MDELRCPEKESALIAKYGKNVSVRDMDNLCLCIKEKCGKYNSCFRIGSKELGTIAVKVVDEVTAGLEKKGKQKVGVKIIDESAMVNKKDKPITVVPEPPAGMEVLTEDKNES